MYSSDTDEASPDIEHISTTSSQGGDIYERINSILDGDQDQQTPDSELVRSISDILGLNSPRGPFLNNTSLPHSPVGFGRKKFNTSSPFPPHYRSEDDIASPVRPLHRSFEMGFHSTPNSPMVPRRQNFVKYNNFSDYGSPVMDSGILSNSTRSLSPSESITSSSGFADCNLSDMMGSMKLPGSYSSSINSDQHLSGMQSYNSMNSMQNTLKLLQTQQQFFQASLLSLLHQQGVQGAAALNRSMSSVVSNSPTSNVGDGNGNTLERAARFHKNAAAFCDASCTWWGSLPPRNDKNAVYSCKVFVGGMPYDLTEQAIEQVFSQFGIIRVEWPGKEQFVVQPKGYSYIVLETEKQVRMLLSHCRKDSTKGGSLYYKITSRRIKSKEVEIIPWKISDCTFAKSSCQKLDLQKTVFVGALHGMITAEGLANIMDDLFGGVIYVGLDTDKYKYPSGSARVTFDNTCSYMKAITAAFIEIDTPKFSKKIQVDPYMEDAFCSSCKVQQGPYFCRAIVCFRYFCRGCWLWQHTLGNMKDHEPMMRSSKNLPILGFGKATTPSARFN